mmetsp:Transcript_29405/g.82136  ORF Transcript_29405/g.82136 Transcript_29405/m.82136 type:complete len:99 (-) Transcript_29405:56-352(-)
MFLVDPHRPGAGQQVLRPLWKKRKRRKTRSEEKPLSSMWKLMTTRGNKIGSPMLRPLLQQIAAPPVKKYQQCKCKCMATKVWSKIMKTMKFPNLDEND